MKKNQVWIGVSDCLNINIRNLFCLYNILSRIKINHNISWCRRTAMNILKHRKKKKFNVNLDYVCVHHFILIKYYYSIKFDLFCDMTVYDGKRRVVGILIGINNFSSVSNTRNAFIRPYAQWLIDCQWQIILWLIYTCIYVYM